MFKIDSFGATPSNTFTEGSPSTGDPATRVSAEWLTAIQTEIVNTVEAAGLTLNKADSTQLLQAVRSLAASGSSGVNGVGSNEIINGEFTVMQRATSAPGGVLTRALAAAVTAYAMDRWQSSPDGAGGAGTATISRQAFTAGQTDVPRSPSFFMRHVQAIASTVAAPFARQKVEGVASYQGTYTFSVYMQATSAISCSLRITQKFGTGGSADVVVNTTAISVTTSFARKTMTVALPSVAGKTITADSHLLVEVIFPSGSTFTVDLADAQLEASPSATGFQRRSRTIEIALCRRYYEKSIQVDDFNGANFAFLNGAAAAHIATPSFAAHHFTPLAGNFLVEKRGTPVVVFISPSGQQTGAVDVEGVSTAVGAAVTPNKHSTGYPAMLTAPTGLGHAHWTADAEL